MFDRRAIILLMALATAVTIAALPSSTAAPQEHKTLTFLEHLKPGQPVAFSEKDGRYEIGVFPENFRPLGHKVVEVNQDHIVFRDLVEITDTIVPIYSIKSITVLRIGGK